MLDISEIEKAFDPPQSKRRGAGRPKGSKNKPKLEKGEVVGDYEKTVSVYKDKQLIGRELPVRYKPMQPGESSYSIAIRLRTTILDALQMAGGPRYLARQAEINPVAFMALLARMVQIAESKEKTPTDSIQLRRVEYVIVDPNKPDQPEQIREADYGNDLIHDVADTIDGTVGQIIDAMENV